MSSQVVIPYSSDSRTAATNPVRSLNLARLGAWCIAVVDVVALELSLFLGYLLRIFLLRWFPNDFQPANYQGLTLGVLAIPLAFALMDIYPGYGMSPVERLRSRVQSSAIVFSLLLGWDYLVQGHQWSRGIMLGTAVFGLLLPPIFEEIARHSLGKCGVFGVPVLILGGGSTAAHVIRHLRGNPSLGYRPSIVLDDDPEKHGGFVEGVPIVGSLGMASEFQTGIQTAILAIPRIERFAATALMERLPFAQVIFIPELVSSQSLWITPKDLGGILGLEINRNILNPINHVLKRGMDLLIALPLALASLPVLALCAAMTSVLSRGGVFFRQLREGKHSLPLRMLKLRTMQPDAEMTLLRYLELNPDEAASWRRYYKLRRDPRIVPIVGTIIRRFSLDELPQLWHVITGEMSLVGPRPFPEYHLKAFSSEFRKLRASVTPGLTGLWQVSARSDGDLSAQEELDRYYIQNWSPWLDLHILVRTFRVVLLGKGAY